MTNRIFILLLAAALAGCGGRGSADTNFHVALIRKEPGKALLEITRREPVVADGPDGYTGLHKVIYWAALAGNGPTFVNPHFSDVPAEYHCVGSIILDVEHNAVEINMRRVVSKPGEPEETAPHPANGVYHIEKVKRSRPGDWWF